MSQTATRWLIRGALIEGAGLPVDLLIEGAQIAAIGPALEVDPSSVARTVDANGAWLLPGLVDPLVRLREPGASHKARLAGEARAALARGITWLGMAPDTTPAIESTAVVEMILRRSQAAGGAQVLPYAALWRPPGQLNELATLAAAGCPLAADQGSPIDDASLLRRSMQYASSLDLPLMLQPIDRSLSADGVAHDGAIAARMGLQGIPRSAETVALARILLLAEDTGARVIVGPLSTAASVQQIRQAQSRGVQVTGMVSTLQISLNELDLYPFRSVLHLQPPLREESDRTGLLEGLRDGVIGILCSDHQPHDADAKLAPFGDTESGASTLDAHLGLGLRLVQDGLLSLPEWLARASLSARAWLGLARPQWQVGARVDLVLVNPHQPHQLQAGTLLSAGSNCPFLGWQLPGVALAAAVDDHLWLSGNPL